MNDQSSSTGQRRLWTIGFPVLLVAVGILVYANSLEGPFIHDDAPTIGDPNIHHLWPPPQALWASSESVAGGRPVVSLTLALNYALGGLDVRGYHVVNIALHILCALVLYAIIRRTLDGEPLRARFGGHAGPLALACSLLWMVHPVQTQVVDYVSHRAESIMALFYLLTLYCAIRARSAHRRWWWTGASVVCCALGMASKEAMVTAPLMVILYDWAYRTGRWRPILRQRIGLYAGLAATWIILAALMAAGQRATVTGFGGEVSVLQYMMNQCLVIGHYLRLVVWPHPLNIDYGWPRVLNVYEVAPWAALLAALLAVTAIAFVWRPALGYPAVWFFAILAPTSSVVPIITEVGADRRIYLSLAGPIALIVIGCCGLALRAARRDAKGVGSSLGWVGFGLVMAAAIPLAWLTARRNEAYRDPVTIWQTAVEAGPKNPRALNNLANQLVARGRLDEAVTQYIRALRLNGDYALAHINLGNALREQGRLAEAVDHYVRGLERLPTDAPAAYRGRSNLGKTLLLQGRIDEAADEFRAVLELRPDLADAHHHLALALGQLGRLDEAISHFRQALEVRPGDPETHFHLAIALRMTGNPDEAISHFREVLQIRPDHARAHFNLGALLQARGRTAEAVRHYRLSLRAEPDSVSTRFNLGVALQSQGNLEEAEEHLRHLLRLRPDHPQAHHVLGKTLAAAGRYDAAIAELRQASRLRADWPMPLNDLAWILATHPDPGIREPDEAIRLAERAAALARSGEPTILDTLAAAYASAGRFDEAVATARQAATLADAARAVELSTEIRTRLDLYEQRRPYRAP